MATLKEILQKYVNLEYNELVAIAKTATAEILPACKVIDTDNEGVLLLSGIILSALAADGSLSALEKKFVCDVLNINEDTFEKFLSLYDEIVMELVDKFADALTVELKAATLALVSAIAACDETITTSESAFIQKLLA